MLARMTMIRGMHALFYTPDADAVREFFRDKLQLDHIDSGGGWLIFSVPKAELGVHPADSVKHQLSFWCDDIDSAVATLKERGVELSPIKDTEWGRITTIHGPAGLEIGLYQPKHAQPD